MRRGGRAWARAVSCGAGVGVGVGDASFVEANVEIECGVGVVWSARSSAHVSSGMNDTSER